MRRVSHRAAARCDFEARDWTPWGKLVAQLFVACLLACLVHGEYTRISFSSDQLSSAKGVRPSNPLHTTTTTTLATTDTARTRRHPRNTTVCR